MATRLLQRAGAPVAAMARSRVFKPAVFVACLVPAAWLGWRVWQFFVGGDLTALGVDPNITIMHETGKTALVLLLIALSVTPLRRLLGVNRLQSVRRMLGVFAFAYACLHLSGYLIFEQLCYSFETCEWKAIKEDILKRRFIFAGMFTFSILSLLALTSTTGWQRRLKKNWQRLHRLVYVAAIAAIVHFVWIQKSDYTRPTRYAIVLAVLLAIRVYFALQKRAVRAAAPRVEERRVAP